MTLDHEDIEAVAARLAQLVADRVGEPMPRLVDAATLARILGVSRATVYAKAEELGAVRLGTGKRARLRFDPSAIVAGTQGRNKTLRRPTPRRRRSRKSRHEREANLLPILGGRASPPGPLRS
jgi:DNA-binding transcriptional MocR family regulator